MENILWLAYLEKVGVHGCIIPAAPLPNFQTKELKKRNKFAPLRSARCQEKLPILIKTKYVCIYQSHTSRKGRSLWEFSQRRSLLCCEMAITPLPNALNDRAQRRKKIDLKLPMKDLLIKMPCKFLKSKQCMYISIQLEYLRWFYTMY